MSQLYNPVIRLEAPAPVGMTEEQIAQANLNWDRRFGKPPYANRMPEWMVPSPPDLDKSLPARELDGLVHDWHHHLLLEKQAKLLQFPL